jgi:hypothetical protein
VLLPVASYEGICLSEVSKALVLVSPSKVAVDSRRRDCEVSRVRTSGEVALCPGQTNVYFEAIQFNVLPVLLKRSSETWLFSST